MIGEDDFETAIIERQRIAIETLLNAIRKHLENISSHKQLEEVYLQISSASSMPGTSEQ